MHSIKTIVTATSAVVLGMCAAFSPAKATPILTFQPWDSSQTSLFSDSGTVGTSSSWQGNNLLLQYGAAFGSSARSLSSSFQLHNPLPSPASAVGIAFDVVSDHFPTGWAVNLDLGRYVYGMMASDVVYNFANGTPNVVTTFAGGMLTQPDEQLFWSSFTPLVYSYIGGRWSVEMFFPDVWLFNRDNLAQRFIFTGTHQFTDVTALVPSTTEFLNVSWILSSPFPVAPLPPTSPPPPTDVPEPSTLTLLVFGLLSLGSIRALRYKHGARLQ